MNIFSTKNEVRNYWEQLKREGKKIMNDILEPCQSRCFCNS
jgi:hypothetical protein